MAAGVTAGAVAARDVREGGRWTRAQRLKNDVIAAVARGALALVSLLPARAVDPLCRALGVVAWALLGAARRAVRARLAAVGLRGERRVVAAFAGVAASAGDGLALLDPEERAGRTLALPDEARATFADALAEGRGVVFVAAHLGPFERMAARLVEAGLPVATVARESYDPRLTGVYERIRAPRGVRSIWRGRPGSAAAVLRELRARRAVGFLVDLPGRVPSTDVTLLGAPTRMAIGPARIALRTGAALLIGTPAPAGGEPGRGRPSLEIRIERLQTADPGEVVPAEPGNLDNVPRDVRLTRRIAAALDARIRALPERWLGLASLRASRDSR